MEIVISLQDKVFENIKENNTITPDQIDYITSSILYGIQLPEEHGRLGDLDELTKILQDMADDEWNTQVGSSKGLEDAIDVIDSIKMISEDMDNHPSETYLNTPHNCDTKYWEQLSLCQYQCPECGHIQYGDRNSELNYCSNCGSRNRRWRY